jgi:hypothetical protein
MTSTAAAPEVEVEERPGRLATMRSRLWRGMLPTAAIGLFVVTGAVWLWRFRRGQPVDIDEAGYMGFAIGDYRGLVDGGLGGFWDAVMSPSIQAPLMTLLVTPVYLVMGPSILPSFVVPLLFGGVMLAAAYGLGHALGGRRVAWLTLAMCAASPVLIAYSRSFNFAIAAGATSALMLWAVARSRNFERPAWSALAGLFAGFALLSRTLVIAFIPALAVAAVIAVAAGPRRGRRACNVSLAAVVGLVTAGPWYEKNGQRVLDYLTSTGYGPASAAYGQDQSVLSLDSWRATAQYAASGVALPLLLLWVLGFGAAFVLVLARCRRLGLGPTCRLACRSPLLPSLVWALWGVATLTSSGNKGSGFLVPLIPALAVVTAWAVVRFPRPAANLVTGLVVLILATNTAVSLDPRPTWTQPKSVTLPWLGETLVSNGQGTIQKIVTDNRPGRSGQLSPARARAWKKSLRGLADRLDRAGPGLIAFGFRHALVNPNPVQLEQLVAGRPPLTLTMIDPTSTPNDPAEMHEWLTTGYDGSACQLLTAGGTSYEIEPRVDDDLLVKAARDVGFVRTSTWQLPDRRIVVVWRRSSTCPVQAATP